MEGEDRGGAPKGRSKAARMKLSPSQRETGGAQSMQRVALAQSSISKKTNRPPQHGRSDQSAEGEKV